MRLTEILRTKGDHVVTIAPDATVGELVDLLARYNIGAAVVSRDGTTVDGIVSERDVVRRLPDLGPNILSADVATIMTSAVHTAEPRDTVHELMMVMTERRIRHVPVTDPTGLVGIVSIGDLVKSRIGELEFERAQLEGYIAGA